MTAGKLLMQFLVGLMAMGGLLVVLDILVRPSSWRSGQRVYRMPSDVHDDQRRVAEKGKNTMLGMRR